MVPHQISQIAQAAQIQLSTLRASFAQISITRMCIPAALCRRQIKFQYGRRKIKRVGGK